MGNCQTVFHIDHLILYRQQQCMWIELQLLHILANTYYCRSFFHCSHCGGGLVVLCLHGFDFYFVCIVLFWVPVHIFCAFLMELSVILLNCKRFLYILDSNSFKTYALWIFFHSLWLFCVHSSISETTVFILIKLILTFFFYGPFFLRPKEIFAYSWFKKLSHIFFSSRNFIVLAWICHPFGGNFI